MACTASPSRLLPVGAVSGHTEEEEEVVICFKAMTMFPSNVQGQDGERFLGASPDRELCNVVKSRIVLGRHKKETEYQQTASCLLQPNIIFCRVSSSLHFNFFRSLST